MAAADLATASKLAALATTIETAENRRDAVLAARKVISWSMPKELFYPLDDIAAGGFSEAERTAAVAAIRQALAA